jgi:hypothetical protein
MKNAWQNQHKVNLPHSARKNVKICLLKHSSRVITSLILNQLLEVSTLSCLGDIEGVRILGSYFLQLRLPGAFRDFLRKVFPELLQEVDMQTRIQLGFVHDGSVPHFQLAVREFLNKVLLEKRIGRVRPAAGTARYPDLNT